MLGNVKKYLNDNDLKMVVFNEDEIIYKSEERGIKPIYILQKDFSRDLVKNSYVGDRIIGKAAAIILVNLEIKGIYTEIISESAYELFAKNSIKVRYEKKVTKILNRDKSDLCPMEKLSQKYNNYDKLITEIEKFLEKVEG